MALTQPGRPPIAAIRINKSDTSMGPLSTVGNEPPTGETGEPRARSLRNISRTTWFETVLPIAVFVVVVLTGMTTSSIGNALLRENPEIPLENTWGDPLPIRSDEWLTQAPIELAVMANGTSMRSPLAQEPDLIYQISSGGIFESIMFFEGNLLRLGPYLPDHMLFAAFRAFPFLLLALSLPRLLRQMGANTHLSRLALALTVFAPASLWWSFMPIRVLGFASAGSMLLIVSASRLKQRHAGSGIALAGLAGLLCARMASYYVPWSITVGLPVIAATAVLLLSQRPVRAGLSSLFVGAVTGSLVLAGMVYNNLDALNAELNTVYPGLRRMGGEALRPFLLWGGPGLFDLESEPGPLIGNQSENTSAYALFALVALLLWRSMRPAAASTASTVQPIPLTERNAMRTLAGFVIVWLCWTMLPLGSVGEAIPLLNQLPPARVAQTVGFPATLLGLLVLSKVDLRSEWPKAVFVGFVAAAVTAYGVRDLRRALATVSNTDLLIVCIITGVAVTALVYRSQDWRPSAAIGLGLMALAATVNPIAFGLGDLRDSDAARFSQQLSLLANRDSILVASDHIGVNGLLVANGVPALTGYQVTGPVREEWLKLDPTARYEEQWNRGASYLRVGFDKTEGSSIEITTPYPDNIVISTHPCALTEIGVGYVITAGHIAGSCLEPAGSFVWAGLTQSVYRVTD